VSDNGLQFSSDQLRKFSQEYDFKHTTTSPYYPQANGEAESGVCIAKKILRQHDPFLALMPYRATPHTATGVSPFQLMMGREIRTLLPTLESNLKPIFPNQEAVTSKDERAKTTYGQYFDKRHGVKSLPDLQPGDVVSVKLDQQKGWKTPGKVIARSYTPRSYVIQTPSGVMRRNRRHLRRVTSPNKVEIPDEPELEPELQAEDPSAGSPDAEPEEPQQIVKPYETAVASSAGVQPSVPEVRTSSGRVMRKPARLRDYAT